MQPPRRTRMPGPIDEGSWTYESRVLADGAAGFWRLNDAGAVAVDATGQGHDGAITNGTLTSTGGPGNRGYLSFAGTGYVSIPYWSALNTTTGPFTAEAWFRTASAPGTGTSAFSLISRGVSDLWSIDLVSTRAVQAFFRYGASSYSTYPSSNNAWSASVWHHVVMVKAGSSGAGTVYLNGVSLGTLPSSGAVVSNTSDGLLLGAITTSTRRLIGDLALCAWYPAALTACQVADHYAAI